MTEKIMSVCQSSGPQVVDRPENSSNSREASAGERQVQFEDVDLPFQVILFADDEPEIVQAQRFLLEAFGFCVLIADFGVKALDLRDGAIDAVVVDHRMLGKDSEQSAREIHEFGRNMPIIVSSRCFSLPQILGLVDAPADEGAVSKALQEMLEQQFQALMHGDEILTN
jgi:CheY-like chemotaxis protein